LCVATVGLRDSFTAATAVLTREIDRQFTTTAGGGKFHAFKGVIDTFGFTIKSP
jgi:hypothetical protein